MTKSELRTIAETYGLEILRNPVTQEAWGLQLVSGKEIPDLTAICNKADRPPVVGSVEYSPFDVTYKIVCPQNWFDLWGWK